MGARHLSAIAFLLLSASTAYAQCGATNLWPVCEAETPCPKEGTYYYCGSGIAVNGCRPLAMGPFPNTDCCAQCLTKPIPTVGNCTTNPPCPRDNSTYFWCSAGKAYNGCRPIEQGPFPPIDCDAQCTFTAPSPVQTCNITTPCPRDGSSYFYCTEGSHFNGCRPASMGEFPPMDCTAQCLTRQSPSFNACTTNPPCPRDNSTYFWCSAGREYNGCRPIEQGPFPSFACDAQCLFTAPSPVQACNMTTPCPRDGTTYFYCTEGSHFNGCRPASMGQFPDIDCSAQCTWSAAPGTRKLLAN